MPRILILLFMALAALGCSYAQAFTINGIAYEPNADGASCRVVYNADSPYNGVVDIPSAVEHNGATLSVTEIADTAFIRSDVSDLTIPATIAGIGKNAFAGCSDLKRLRIPSLSHWCSVKFANAKSSPFADHFYGIQELWIGGEQTDSLSIATDVPAYAFYGWECLHVVNFEDAVTAIGTEAFNACPNIRSLHFGAGLRTIAVNAFQRCEYLRTITVPSLDVWCSISFANAGSNPTISGGVTKFVADGATVSDLVIPQTAKTVGQYAFYNAQFLNSVTIPDNVTAIGSMAFFMCEKLVSATRGFVLNELPIGLFMQCKALSSVDFGQTVENIGQSAFSNCSSLATLSLPASLKTIGQTSFAFLTALTELHIPDEVERLGQGCFSWCTELQSVDMPETVQRVDFAAFAFCDKLKDVAVKRLTAPEAPQTNPPFSSTAYSNATLSVPQGASQSYSTAPGWKKFSHIVESGTTGATDITAADAPTVKAAPGQLTVTANADTRWTIHTLTGTSAATGTGSATLSLPTGLYIFSTPGAPARKLRIP